MKKLTTLISVCSALAFSGVANANSFDGSSNSVDKHKKNGLTIELKKRNGGCQVRINNRSGQNAHITSLFVEHSGGVSTSVFNNNKGNETVRPKNLGGLSNKNVKMMRSGWATTRWISNTSCTNYENGEAIWVDARVNLCGTMTADEGSERCNTVRIRGNLG